jgi:hypothetical protein
MGGNESLDRETSNPALAMEDRFESGFECLRKAIDSDGLEATGLDAPDRGFETATGSLLDCINAAMDGLGFTPAKKGWRKTGEATWVALMSV